MPELEQQIAGWRGKILAARISPDDAAELESHLRDEIADLVKSGVPEEKAFCVAITLLGDVKKLRREFSRGRCFRLLNFRENPPALNFLAACFALRGFNAFADLARTLTLDLTTVGPYATWITAGIYSIFGLQLFIGIGLALRSNFWRIGAFAAILVTLLSNGYGLVFMLRHAAAYIHPGYCYPLMGFFCPSYFQWLTGPIGIMLMLWAFWFLSGASMRALFQRNRLNHRIAS